MNTLRNLKNLIYFPRIVLLRQKICASTYQVDVKKDYLLDHQVENLYRFPTTAYSTSIRIKSKFC